MEILNQDEVKLKKEVLSARIRRGHVFIHPTDTIYGIGCSALDENAVQKVRDIKNRVPEKPFSVIAPSKDWIRENCEIDEEGEKWLSKLPGPYTLILKLKKGAKIPKNVNSGRKSLGVRIPDHWLSQLVSHSGIPVITASANKRGNEFMTSMEDLDLEVKSKLDFII
jgi:L-threonylcarbamoyladenylate synthase